MALRLFISTQAYNTPWGGRSWHCFLRGTQNFQLTPTPLCTTFLVRNQVTVNTLFFSHVKRCVLDVPFKGEYAIYPPLIFNWYRVPLWREDNVTVSQLASPSSNSVRSISCFWFPEMFPKLQEKFRPINMAGNRKLEGLFSFFSLFLIGYPVV